MTRTCELLSFLNKQGIKNGTLENNRATHAYLCLRYAACSASRAAIVRLMCSGPLVSRNFHTFITKIISTHHGCAQSSESASSLKDTGGYNSRRDACHSWKHAPLLSIPVLVLPRPWEHTPLLRIPISVLPPQHSLSSATVIFFSTKASIRRTYHDPPAMVLL